MHIIDKEGNIIEGQVLSPEELEILTELSTGGINAVTSGYTPEREERKIAQMLISKYFIARRPQSALDDPEA